MIIDGRTITLTEARAKGKPCFLPSSHQAHKLALFKGVKWFTPEDVSRIQELGYIVRVNKEKEGV